jgi:hypothetical protein
MVLLDARERVDRPIRTARLHDIEVTEEREGRPVAGSAEPRDQVRTLGILRDAFALDDAPGEERLDDRRRLRLTARRVRRVARDEPLQQRCCLGPERCAVNHRMPHVRSRRRASG